jgi:hypothetical protein
MKVGDLVYCEFGKASGLITRSWHKNSQVRRTPVDPWVDSVKVTMEILWQDGGLTIVEPEELYDLEVINDVKN